MRRPPPTWARRWARPLFWTLLLLGLAPVLLAGLGAVGTKLGLWSWRFGFGTLSVDWAVKAAYLGVAAGLLATVFAVLARVRRFWLAAAVALLTPALTLGAFAQLKARAQANPFHQVSTDVGDPPMPSAALARLRGPDANPVERDPRTDVRKRRPEVENRADGRVLRLTADLCPDARTVRLPAPPAEAYARAKTAVEAADLAVVTDAPEAGVLEATHQSFWFEFKDDVMVRVRPEGSGSRIDIRSVSRVGGSDLGANCARVTRLVRDLRG